MRHPGRHDYSPVNRRNSDASTGSSVEMEAMGPSAATPTTTTTTLATTTTATPARTVVNLPAVGQPDLAVPGVQSRSDISPSSAESGDGPARFVIIGGAGSMNQFDLSPTAQWDFEQEPNRAAASLRLCIWAMFLFACMVMFRVQQDKLAQEQDPGGQYASSQR
ncbi:hypothetical protein FOZ60_010354 [Perkinsus olseni]|uniref:Uncharacterized protein n=1 Tax=Perkinsus olseni TaxID=32597 RepID=A0A7J6PE79_PEROL|nr:hypothetical protein FOZ60_010354 [Perkinsus olseni]